MRQLTLPTVGTREELATAMKVTPSQVVPKAEENTVMNVPYGDNSLNPKGLNHTRVVLCNLNGISHHDSYAKAKEIGEGMLNHQADIGAFTEPKLNFSIKELRNKIHGKL